MLKVTWHARSTASNSQIGIAKARYSKYAAILSMHMQFTAVLSKPHANAKCVQAVQVGKLRSEFLNECEQWHAAQSWSFIQHKVTSSTRLRMRLLKRATGARRTDKASAVC